LLEQLPPQPPTDASPEATTASVRATGVLLLGLAAWFLWGSPSGQVPRPDAAVIDAARIMPGARRHPVGEPASVVIGGFSHRCSECHRFLEPPPIQRPRRVQHTEIVLNHGLNASCFNCHSRSARDRLVLYDGTTLPFDQVPRLCAQCHGTVYRDWQRGMHGKTLGSWDASSGKQVRLNCNDCHDPHAPAYRPIEPLPAPNTLRMGDQRQRGHEPAAKHEPLRRWSAEHGSQGDGQSSEAHP
jgi:hypothetical protein